MTPDFPPTQDSPLSLQGEGWGEGALPPNTTAPGKPHSQARPHNTPHRSRNASHRAFSTGLSK